MLLRIILAVASLVTPASAIAAPQAGRFPTGQWVVNFDDAQCFAARNYGTVEKPLYLVLKAPPRGDVMQVMVMKRGFAARPEQQKGLLQFDDQDPIRISLLEHEQADRRLRTFLVNVPSERFQPARKASSVRISTPGLDERFALTSMEALLKTIDDCVADLRRVWNVRESDESPPLVKDHAKGNIAGLFDSSDYPTQAFVEGGTGTVAVAILIDPQGKVADCSVVDTSGVPVLDAQACAVVTERARFTPAIGFDGKPARSAFLQRITWRLQ